MADRELRVVLLGDSSSLQNSMTKAEVAAGNFETRLKNAVVVTGEAGNLSEGLARKMNSLEQLGLNPASIGLIGLAAAGGVVVEGAKTMIDNAEKNEIAQNNLAQAFASQKLKVEDYQKSIDNFLNINKRFIADEYEAKNALATVIRAGFDQTVSMRIMNDALDLSALKHVSLTDAMNTLLMAEEGNTKGLRDLGFSAADLNDIMKAAPQSLKDVEAAHKAVTTAADKVAAANDRLAHAQDALNHEEIVLHEKKKISAADLDTEREKKEAVAHASDDVAKANAGLTKAQNDLATATSGVVVNSQSQAALLSIIEPKIAKGRDSTTQMTQAQNDLNHSTQDFSNRYGPAMQEALANGLDIVNLTIQGVAALGRDLPDLIAKIRGAVGGGGTPSTSPGGLVPGNPGGPFGANTDTAPNAPGSAPRSIYNRLGDATSTPGANNGSDNITSRSHAPVIDTLNVYGAHDPKAAADAVVQVLKNRARGF